MREMAMQSPFLGMHSLALFPKMQVLATSKYVFLGEEK